MHESTGSAERGDLKDPGMVAGVTSPPRTELARRGLMSMTTADGREGGSVSPALLSCAQGLRASLHHKEQPQRAGKWLGLQGWVACVWRHAPKTTGRSTIKTASAKRGLGWG